MNETKLSIFNSYVKFRMVIFMIMTLMTIILIIKLHRHRPQVEKVGTDGSQRGNQRLPWQGTAGSRP